MIDKPVEIVGDGECGDIVIKATGKVFGSEKTEAVSFKRMTFAEIPEARGILILALKQE